MFLGLKSIQRDVNFCALTNLDHKFDKQRALCKLTKINAKLSHLYAVFQRKVCHDPTNPKNTSDTSYANVGLVLLQPFLSVSINSVQKQLFEAE
jgi:hypothetical protein